MSDIKNNPLADFEIFRGTSFADVCKDIFDNQNKKKVQLDVLVSELRSMVKTANDAITVVPLIRDYIEVGVKNDEQLVKMLGVVQRIVSKSSDANSESSSMSLTAEEISQLTKDVEDIKTSVEEPIADSVKTVQTSEK